MTEIAQERCFEETDGVVFRKDRLKESSSITANDTEKARLLLVTQLMSLQLVYSVKDIGKMNATSLSGTSVEADEYRNEERLDWLKTLQLSLSSLTYCRPNMEGRMARSPPSSPSGYETASAHSSENDIHSAKEHSNEINGVQEGLDEAASFSNVCSPILDKLRTPYGPRKSRILENLLDTNMLGCNADDYLAPTTLSKTLNDLRKDLYQLKLYIHTDIVEFCRTYFHMEELPISKGV